MYVEFTGAAIVSWTWIICLWEPFWPLRIQCRVCWSTWEKSSLFFWLGVLEFLLILLCFFVFIFLLRKKSDFYSSFCQSVVLLWSGIIKRRLKSWHAFFFGSGAEYVRKEIPLQVLPTSSLIKLDSPLVSFTDLQHVLYEEERAAYNQAVLQNMRFNWYVSTSNHDLY